MKKMLTGVVLALGMSICCSASILRDSGPCYGYGCPSLSASNKPYDAKANKDQKTKDDTVNADKNAKPAPDQQTPPAKATQ
jgi:hypothetical protein